MNDKMMSMHEKLPELRDSDWSMQSRKEVRNALTHDKIKENDFTREIDNLDEPIYGNGKTIDTKCVAQVGNYMVIDSELNGDCLYAAVIQSNDTMFKWGKPFEEELPERAKVLRERTYRHLQDLVFDSIDVMASQNTISPDHINMLSQTHATLDRKLSGRPQIIPQAIKKEVVEGYYSPALAPSPDFVITVNEIATNPQHPDATPSVKDEIEEIGDTICNFPSCDKPKWAPYDFCGNTHAMMAGAKPIDISHKEKGIEQRHTWDSRKRELQMMSPKMKL